MSHVRGAPGTFLGSIFEGKMGPDILTFFANIAFSPETSSTIGLYARHPHNLEKSSVFARPWRPHARHPHNIENSSVFARDILIGRLISLVNFGCSGVPPCEF